MAWYSVKNTGKTSPLPFTSHLSMKAEENDTNSTFWTQIESVNDELF